MRLRSTSFVIALSLAAISVVGTATPAFAQVSDADRNAARDLYVEGDSLRAQGRYADALDRYNRSFAVFPAPTTAFRAAQCRAALGQLVEAAEQLRAVANSNLGAGASEAFVKARQEAATELAAIEPRIPKVKINVLPAGVQGLSVTVDGVQMSAALVGVARPINPGTHRIGAVAPGFSASQASIDIRERQQPIPEVTLTLQPGNSGVSYTSTPPSTNPPQGTVTSPPTGTTTPPPYNPAYANNGGYPPGFTPYGQWIPPARREGPRTALLIGVDAAVSVIAGSGDQSSYGPGADGSVPVGWNIGADVGLRFGRIGYVGALAQGTFWSTTDRLGNTTSITSFALDAVLGLITNPEGVGFYGEVGGGLRTNSQVSASIEGVIGLGIQFKAGPLRIIPKFDIYFGPNDGGGHAFFTFGAAGFWELPLDRPTVVQPPPSF